MSTRRVDNGENMLAPGKTGEKGGETMFLSLLLPFGASVLIRLALRPRSQRPQPLEINLPVGWLVAGWGFVSIFAVWANMVAGMSFEGAAFLTGVATVFGLATPEFLRGLSQVLSKPVNWLLLIGGGVVLYGLLVTPEWMIALGIVLCGIWVMIPKKKKKKGG